MLLTLLSSYLCEERNYWLLLFGKADVLDCDKWMMHLYSALLCIAVHPKRFTIMWGGSLLHLDDVTAATGQRRQCAHHTPATGGEERES